MNTNRKQQVLRRTLMSLAVAGACTPAFAADADDDVAKLTNPESTVSVGAGVVSGDSRSRSLFGQYNGMRRHDGSLLLDLDYVRRDNATGLWTKVWGRDLGLDTREMGVTVERQGDWKIGAEYNELVRRDPRTINTGVTGIGTTTPTVNLIAAGSGSNVDLDMKRKGFSFNAEKWLMPTVHFEFSFKNEDKDGARMFGRGFNCTSSAAPLPTNTSQFGCAAAPNSQWALLMVPEPINSTTRQVEAKLRYAGERLTLQGGYYGTFYTNANGNVTPTVPGSLYNPLGVSTVLATPAGAGMTSFNGIRGILASPVALPPDNQAHQFSLAGTYAITQTTRMNFKYAYTHLTQDRDFAAMGLANAPAGVSNLNGRMDTNLIQAGITSRPIPKLTITGNFKIEDRKDKTPDAQFNFEGTSRFANTQSNLKRIVGKLEGSYLLPAGFRGTVGMDYESADRGQFGLPDSVGGVAGLRQKTWELGYRGELRRMMTETVSGALMIGHSRRDGSVWLKPNTLPATGVTAMSDAQIWSRTSVFPAVFTDRERDKVRLMTDWQPTEKFSLQLYGENARDRYNSPSEKGLRNADAWFYGLDGTWQVAEDWKLTGYVSQGNQQMQIDHSTGYMARLKNLTTSAGLGVVGKVNAKFDLGGNLAYTNDRNIYGQGIDGGASATNLAYFATFPGLPDVVYRQTRASLFGTYTIDKQSSIRFDMIHVRARLNEWTWSNNGVPFMFSDGTTVSLNPDQRVTYLGGRYSYKF